MNISYTHYLSDPLRIIFMASLICYSVDRWAEDLGSEIWEMANAVARPDELKIVSIHIIML